MRQLVQQAEITIPKGITPGMTLRISVSGVTVDVVVPAGVVPGETIAVEVPMPVRQEPIRNSARSSSSSSRCSYTVVFEEEKLGIVIEEDLSNPSLLPVVVSVAKDKELPKVGDLLLEVNGESLEGSDDKLKAAAALIKSFGRPITIGFRGGGGGGGNKGGSGGDGDKKEKQREGKERKNHQRDHQLMPPRNKFKGE